MQKSLLQFTVSTYFLQLSLTQRDCITYCSIKKHLYKHNDRLLCEVFSSAPVTEIQYIAVDSLLQCVVQWTFRITGDRFPSMHL